ncbi:MAG TPA: FMN-binding protein [Burkholderiales bacterium]|nr:FMN-binding protein [Burkholderiales bacterium]
MPPRIVWLAAPAVLAAPAHATQYLTVEQAQAALFPAGTRLAPQDIALSEAQIAAIEEDSGQRVRQAKPAAWRSPDGGWFFVDEVVGKHEFITYALALDASGAVRGIEILDYRETYGGEIRRAEWRMQFLGKRRGDAFKLGGNIRNITGATLSCRNVMNGVKRLLSLHALVLAK